MLIKKKMFREDPNCKICCFTNLFLPPTHRHVGNGAVIARCSQPEVGWWGWRCGEDEDLLKAIFDACNYDRGPKALFETNRSSSPNSINSGENVQARPDITDEENKVGRVKNGKHERNE